MNAWGRVQIKRDVSGDSKDQSCSKPYWNPTPKKNHPHTRMGGMAKRQKKSKRKNPHPHVTSE